MLKNILIALGIAALTSSPAFAAVKTAKTTTAHHKVAQADESKPGEAKVKKEKKAKTEKKDKKGAEAGEKTAAPAPAPAAK